MKNKYSEILKNILKEINPEEELLEKKQIVKKFVKDLEKKLKDKNLEAQVFIGGSFAKNTLIKKEVYDADVFVRFAKKYSSKDLSIMLKKVTKDFKRARNVHGSRDYVQIRASRNFVIEVIPVLKISNPKQAQNITDLSYSHVRYVNKKVKNKKTLDEIKLAKAFCRAQGVYGAESYINGFSGYALELLVIHYKTFLNFIKKTSSKKPEEKIIIDMEKQYKNKNLVLMDINESKLNSPIILVDPTYKHRNALAALSTETFEKFQISSKKFLKNPSIKYFEIQKTNLEKIKKITKSKKQDFILLKASTPKQEGNIAGSKLLKFYNHLTKEISKEFDIKDRGFNYNDKKSSKFFFVAKPKKEIVVIGPKVKDKKNFERFKKKHSNIKKKKGSAYTKVKTSKNLKDFVKKWKKNNSRKIRDMDVESLEIADSF